jgi:hypothetical protein
VRALTSQQERNHVHTLSGGTTSPSGGY